MPRTSGLRARRSYFVAAATAAALLAAGNPLARALGLHHWSSSGDERKLAFLERAPEAPEVLLLGSSRIKFGLMATAMERRFAARLGRPVTVFNAALASSGVVEASWILDEVAARLGCPRVVVADVNVEGLNAASDRLEQGLRLYLPPHRWPSVLPHLTAPDRLEAALEGLATGYGHLLYAMAHPPRSTDARSEAARVLTCRGSVYGPPEVACGERPETDLAAEPDIRRRRQLRWYRLRLRRFHRLDDFRLGGLPEQGLERLAELCRHCRARLVLVTLPTLYPWEEWGWGEAVAATSRRAAALARLPEVRYIDYTLPAEELATRDFYDPGHLSRRGARRLSLRLADEVAPALPERPAGPAS
jgi:hypothetical protein